MFLYVKSMIHFFTRDTSSDAQTQSFGPCVQSSCLCQVRVQCDIGGWGYIVCSVPEAWSRAQTQHGARVVSSAFLIKDDDVKVVGSQFPRATSLAALGD